MRERRAAALLVAALIGTVPASATAQFSAPCEAACALTLGAVGFSAATGAAVVAGRFSGGLSRPSQGLGVWGVSFGLVVGGGIALSGDGGRQRRAVYGAAAGTLVGSVAGLAVESVRTGGDGARSLAGSLMGAAVGALAGGVYSALSYDGADPSEAVPLFSVRLSL